MHTFRPHGAGVLLTLTTRLHSLSLHPGSVSCPTFTQRHLFSAAAQPFNPSHPCTGLLFGTLNEGFVLIHASRTPSSFLGGLGLRVFHTQSLTHFFFVVDREKPVWGDTHHKRRVDFSVLPESQLQILLHSGEAGPKACLGGLRSQSKCV